MCIVSSVPTFREDRIQINYIFIHGPVSSKIVIENKESAPVDRNPEAEFSAGTYFLKY